MQETGDQRLGFAGDGCPQAAVPCQGGVGIFSDKERNEVPPWVETGRYLLYLKEHPPQI